MPAKNERGNAESERERGDGERCESAAFILCVTARFMFMCVGCDLSFMLIYTEAPSC